MSSSRFFLPDPCIDGEAGVSFLTNIGDEWNALVAKLQYFNSACDRNWIPTDATTAESRSFVCNVCTVCFSTNKALACHQRRKHGLRTDTRFYVEFGKLCVLQTSIRRYGA